MKNELKSMFTEHWKYLAVNAACELKLFDKIFEGQDTSDKLVQTNNWDLKSLTQLLNFLLSDKYLTATNKNIYCVSKKGNLLREKNLAGLFYACLNWSGEHLSSWQQLSHSIATGKSSFEHIYQHSYFDYLNKYPEKLDNYHKAMFEYANDDYKELPNIIDFGTYHSIMDVGGGYGAAIALIQQKYSNVKCFLFDLELVIEKVINGNLEKIKGDFFVSIPNVAEVLLLSRVLHDWSNEKAVLLLQNCFDALPSNGTLYVIENCTDKTESDLSLLSLNMTLICESFERSSAEYINLIETTGFIFQSDARLNQLQTILVFKK